MGQLLLQDNIPNIVVASTTSVTLAPTNQSQTTTVTVGGQQWSLSSTLTLNTGSTGANGLDTGSLGAIQLWYVYTIVSSSTFAPALIASQTGPSTGPTIPAGYFSAYKLVGAFYTNGTSGVGSAVSIVGKASTDWFSMATATAPGLAAGSTVPAAGGLVVGASTTGPTFGTASWNTTRMRRDGDTVWIEHSYANSSSGTAGSGTYVYLLPSTLPPDTTKFDLVGGNSARANCGSGQCEDGTNGRIYGAAITYIGTTYYGISLQDNAGTSISHGSSNDAYSNSQQRVGFLVQVPISGWKTTLL